MIAYGIHVDGKSEDLQQYMVMPRLGQNLQDFFEHHNCKLPEISIYSLAIKITTLLECLHKGGFAFNDLKLDNLMVGYDDYLPDKEKIACQTPAFEKCTINLVDFGMVTSVFNRQTRQHINEKNVEEFRGNIMFASLN